MRAEGAERVDVGRAPGHRVGIHARDASAWKQGFDMGFNAFGAEAPVLQMRIAADRALLRNCLGEIAVVADQRVAVFVAGQRDIAVLAGFGCAAARAGDDGGEATPIDKQNCLFAARNGGVELLQQQPREMHELFDFAPFLFDVDDVDLRQRLAAGTFAQDQQIELLFARGMKRFEAGRGRSENDERLSDAAEFKRGVAGVITRSAFLFERAIVFFIDNDSSQSRQRCEECRARTDDDIDFTSACRAPRFGAVAVGDVAVEDGDSFDSQTLFEAFGGLWRQRDFRNEHDGLLAGGEDAFEEAQIDFGLAAAGDAMEQEAAVFIFFERGKEHFDGAVLRGVENGRFVAR